MTRNDTDRSGRAEPWWRDGLPFSCRQSGRCCHRRGEYGHVYVNAHERERLAAHLGLTLGAFNRRYTRSEEDGARVLRFVDGRCVFLDGRRCSVHAVKPVQCRTWPFWEELLEDPETYRREVLDFCPGSRGGPLVPAASIRRQMERTEEALWEV